ncbi:MAG: hypothetical protein HFE86_01745 [Clostridiales bacterium]|nr:hypothetical protein [Clostridiales bacterium]
MNRAIWGTSPISEPYPYVSKGEFSGKEVAASPDPLVSYRWDDPKADDDMEIFLRRPVSAIADKSENFDGIESLTEEVTDITVNGEGSICLDFGTEFAGWLEIDSPDLSGGLTLGVSEYNQPAINNRGPKTKTPIKYGDTYRLELKLDAEMYEGVRFGFINITQFEKPFHITGVRLVCQTKPVNYNGSFDSDNEMLNKIWYTAAYTVKAALTKDYFGAILLYRGDRYSWTGDAYPAQGAAMCAFANYDFVLKNLHHTAEHRNNIESYEMYWIFSLIDYYEHTGDKSGVEGLLSQAAGRLDHAYEVYGTNPSLRFFGWDERLGAGFENPNIPENQNSYKLLSIQAWKDFADVLEELGYNELASKYRGYAAEKTAELREDPAWYKAYGMHAATDAINAGVLPETTESELADLYYTDRVNQLSYSPFNQYFILQAMAESGHYDDAISSILDLWGGQIAYGGTTLFEMYRPDWNDGIETNAPVPNNQGGYTSLAHPWSAGVLDWMSEEILGIKPTVAGFKEFTVTPHLGRQLNRVSGEMPTPHGTIEAAFDVEKGEHSVTVPDGTTAKIGIPKTERKIIEIKMNGKIIRFDSEDEDFGYIENLPAGKYTFTAVYEGETPEYIQPEYEYPAEFVGRDDSTKGNWGGVWGADGYVLCNYYGGGEDLRALPDYVNRVSYTKAKSATFANDTDDARAMASNCFNIGSRKLGAYRTDNYRSNYQTFTVDIDLNQEKEYTVALYFVDWDQGGRELAVEMFDGETLNQIAPVKVLSDFSDGVYLIYKYNKSVRFRINQVCGVNVTLSGIFFGEGEGSGPMVTLDTTDDQNPAVKYTGDGWKFGTLEGTFAGTFSYNDTVGDAAEFTFTGKSVSYIASKEFNRGIVEVFLDGESMGKFDLYIPGARRQQMIFSSGELPYGEHTIKAVVTGEKNELSAGSYIDIDVFEVGNDFTNLKTDKYDERDSNVAFTGDGWVYGKISGAYQGTFSYSNAVGAAAEVAFNGVGITLIASKESNRGIAEIFIDGESVDKVDLYSTGILRQQEVFNIDGLTPGKHTLKVMVTGEKNPAASGTYVDVDGFLVESEIFTVSNIAESLVLKQPAKADTALKIPAVPKGFAIKMKETDCPDIISNDGKITPAEEDTQVAVTLMVTKDNQSAERTLLITVPGVPQTRIPDGDLDKDGEVTIRDVMEACKVLARQSAGVKPTDDEMARGNLDGDGAFTIGDVMEICKILARKA